MSKVIRIDDETFLRLQALAEPLIDTPSSVIKRLVDYYESSINVRTAGKLQEVKVTHSKKDHIKSYEIGTPNIFLAPASGENINKTIMASVGLKTFQHLLTEEEIKALQTRSHDTSRLHCWAMTENRRSVFGSMSEGDVVLFSIRASGKFEYYGVVSCKLENEKLGNFLWEVVPSEPWSLIYFLEDVKHIDIDKARLVVELGYKSNYAVPGIIKVNRMNLEIIMNRYGSLENFIESMEGDTSHGKD
ncbi:MAG: hypothetical protein ACE5HI_15195 [bacterium]